MAALEASRVFERPTRDEVFRHLMQNADVRNQIIKCFTPVKDFVETELCDNSLRPLKAHNNMLSILKSPTFEKILNKSDRQRLNFTKCECKDAQEFKADLKLAKKFFKSLKPDFENIKKLLLDDRTGIYDVIAKLPSGEFVLIEFQVERETAQDARFLAYLCHLYGNQLRVGDAWKNLKRVVAVNLLGTGFHGKLVMWGKSDHYKRHYKMTDCLSVGDPRRILPQIELIQFSLGNIPDIKKIEDATERNWLRFFANAQFETEIPAGIPETIAKAYDSIRPERLPESVKAALVEEEKIVINLRDEFRKEGRKKGLKEGRKKGLKEGRKKGLKEGWKKGWKEGWKKGWKEGWKKGLKIGRKEERDEILRLLREEGITDPAIYNRISGKRSCNDAFPIAERIRGASRAAMM
jgi:predicted transposase/invertase (TIGR01784 family)